MTNQNQMEKDLSGDTAMDKAQEVAGQAQQKVSEVTSTAKEQAKRAAAQVTEQAKTTADTRLNDVAQEVNSVAEAVRQTSLEVSGESETVARYGERIADQLESVSSYLNEKGVEDVLTDLQDFARRQPAVFLGGAFMLGMVVGRFIRSSGGNRYSGMEGQGYYDTEYRSSTPYSSSTGSRYTSSGSQSTSAGYGATYQGQNRYRTGLDQASTTNQDES